MGRLCNPSFLMPLNGRAVVTLRPFFYDRNHRVRKKMKLYSCKMAPNARKLLVYLKEKAIIPDIETVEVDLLSGAQYQPEYQAINPLGKVPVLELDDGSLVTESLSIIEYFEEIYPQPSLTGDCPEERAKIKAIERYIDFEFMGTMGIIAHNMMPLFAKRFTQSPDVIEYGRARQREALEHLEKFIGKGPFVCGEKVSIADITLFVTIESANMLRAYPDPKFQNILRCFENFKKRPVMG
ncbi:glutathione S-transferase family protein [Paremcibacter congregatus]|uniref:glutathione S-transferase family protein n=1 Tax=Paremcibacter congregatus TaxID=2043170 RepID=UPI0030EC5D89